MRSTTEAFLARQQALIDIRERERAEAESQANRGEIKLKVDDEISRKLLIDDIQNLIWALRFESGPKAKGKIDNLA